MAKSGKKKRNVIGIILFLIIFLAGAAVLFYPRISYWLAEYNQLQAVQSYNQAISGLSEEEIEKIWAQAQDYNARMVKSIVKDPFAETENIDPFDEYYDTLDVGEGIMGYIRIPAIKVRLPIYHGTAEATLERGVGHIKATALPIGGVGSHSVLTGHSGLHTAKMFDELEEVKLGQEFYLEILGRTLAYRVDQIEVVEPDDISKLMAIDGADHVTLITCTPYGINSHRLLVRGIRTDYDPALDADDETTVAFPWWILVLVLVLILLILLIGRWLRKRREKRKGQTESE